MVLKLIWELKKNLAFSSPCQLEQLFYPTPTIEFTLSISRNIPLGSIKLSVGASILMRRLLKRGNFTSTSDLKQKILDFIAYYNRTMAKPFVWKFEGYPEAI